MALRYICPKIAAISNYFVLDRLIDENLLFICYDSIDFTLGQLLVS
jgi:hypothetical protein